MPSVGNDTELLERSYITDYWWGYEQVKVSGKLFNISTKVKQACYISHLLLPNKPLQPTKMYYFSQFCGLLAHLLVSFTYATVVGRQVVGLML